MTITFQLILYQLRRILYQNGIFYRFYAILRSIPSKLGGVIALLAAILSLIALPFIVDADTRSSDFRPLIEVYILGFCC